MEGPLSEAARLSQLFLDVVEDYAIFVLDPGGTIVTWNTGAARIKGYAASEIIGQSIARFYTPEDLAADKPATLLEYARVHGRVEDEGWRVRKDGSLFWADVVITALRDGPTPTGFIKVMWHGETGALVGAHMIGPAVTDLIAELTLAKTTEVNAESLIYTIHAHPTFAEAIRGASEDAFGHAIDL